MSFLRLTSISLLSTFCMASFIGCNGNQNGTSGQVQGFEAVTVPSSPSLPNPVPAIPTQPTPTPSPSPTSTPGLLGSSCHSSNDQNYCVALKYVVYKDSSGKAVVSESAAINNLAAINQIWSKCQIGFQIDHYVAADPNKNNLSFNTANYEDLEQIRRTFEDNSQLLVVTTGAWNRNGSLGGTGANAWTNMPGETNYGAILEAPVGTYPNIIAHEIGHYIGLDHAGATSNLMSPIIYETSTELDTSQCNEARATINSYWKAMLR